MVGAALGVPAYCYYCGSGGSCISATDTFVVIVIILGIVIAATAFTVDVIIIREIAIIIVIVVVAEPVAIVAIANLSSSSNTRTEIRGKKEPRPKSDVFWGFERGEVQLLDVYLKWEVICRVDFALEGGVFFDELRVDVFLDFVDAVLDVREAVIGGNEVSEVFLGGELFEEIITEN